MDNSKWEAYEQMKKQLRKAFAAEKRKLWLIFVIYNIIADVALYFLSGLITYPLAITLGLVSTGLSFFILLKDIALLNFKRNEQEVLLQQEEPFDGFKI